MNIEIKDEERTRCEVWTRVMGYHRPVNHFNPGKLSEHRERQYFTESGGYHSLGDVVDCVPCDVSDNHPSGASFHGPVQFVGLDL